MDWPVTKNVVVYQGESFEFTWSTADGSPINVELVAGISDLKGKVLLIPALKSIVSASSQYFFFSREQLLTLPCPANYLYDVVVIASDQTSKVALRGVLSMQPGAAY